METSSQNSNQVNNEIYDLYGDRWYTAYDDPIALLRAECKTKFPWILSKIKAHQKASLQHVLDIGCGAGFLSNALAQSGFQVTGVDLSEESLKVAHKHDTTNSVQYKVADAYRLPFADRSFDVVTAMDFLEHVEDPNKIIAEISRVLKPNGLFFFHTFNRNPVSHFVVIKLVEWFVCNTPKDMHIVRLFLKPKEVYAFCRANHLQPVETVGLKPVFSSIPLKNYFTGIVPESLKFEIVSSTMLSYMGYAVKM